MKGKRKKRLWIAEAKKESLGRCLKIAESSGKKASRGSNPKIVRKLSLDRLHRYENTISRVFSTIL